MRLGFYMGYAVPGQSPLDLVEAARQAETLGYDSAWAAEAWGTDAVTPIAWLGARTERIKLGTAIMQIPGRTPANTAMTAATLDLLSGGRFLLGLGTSGPQVVEGWHGEPWGKPLEKTREYVEIVRSVLRRDVLEHHGAHYDIPFSNGTGLGKPLKLMARPLRADVPDLPGEPGAEGDRAGVRDRGRLAAALLLARARPRDLPDGPRARDGFDIAAGAQVLVCDDPQEGIEKLKPYYGFYLGGMGSRERELLQRRGVRYGYEAEARRVQDLFLDGKQREAAAAVPDALVDEVSLVGPRGAHPRPAGRVAGERRHDAARRLARPGLACGQSQSSSA